MYIEILLFILNIFDIHCLNILFSILLYLHIFIIAVLLYVECKKYSKEYILLSFIIKLIFLFIIFKFKNRFGLEFNSVYALSSLLIILIYYYTHDINKEYECNIKNSDLIKSLIFTSIIYLMIFIFMSKN